MLIAHVRVVAEYSVRHPPAATVGSAMSLATYRQKRDFQKTQEPKGGAPKRKAAGLQFVIQKHDASHLHYDFRLEMDGVLKSWAVPQGPCLDPSQRRLAVMVEDHPIEYGGFEGIIPPGQYGGGTVILWDRGTWEPLRQGDPLAGLKAGKLKFTLDGEKLQGGWTLVRMRPKGNEKRENWLLIKERDEFAIPLRDGDILEQAPASVESGRTIAEMAADPSGKWNSRDSGARKPAKSKAAARKAKGSGRGARTATSRPWPKKINPQLATLASEIPDGPEWIHEIKLDGYRLLAWIRDGSVTLKTRNDKDWTHRFPDLARTLSALPVQEAILDGEAVVFTSNGSTSFQELQEALSAGDTSATRYCAFDLLWLNGEDLRDLPLEQRKARLARIVPPSSRGMVLFSEDIAEGGRELFERAKKLKLEGIVSKRRSEPYRSGRGTDWIKVKTALREEFVVGGFTESTAARRGIGAILIGYFEKGTFRYAGKVGTGFTDATNARLRERLTAREIDDSPFAGPVPGGSRTHWVHPEVAVQISFSNWTRDGRLRHPVFQGVRDDKSGEGEAKQIVRDRPLSSVKAKRTGGGKGESVKKTTSRGGRAPAKRRPRAAKPRTTSKPLAPKKFDPGRLTNEQVQELEQVRLTHPERIVFPSEGITKRDLVEYYAEIGPWMLPHVENRPLSVLRCPEGEGQTCFYQKHAGPGMPAAIRSINIREKEKDEPYLFIDSLAGLLSLVQMGILEVHPWGSRCDDIEKPDQLVFDLDPDPSVQWPRVIAGAKELRDRLSKIGLETFLKTTGGKGLHVVVPLTRRGDWPEIKAFSRAIVSLMEHDSPELYTTTMRKAARTGKIFLDYLRNDRGATAVAPYSTRAREGAPVAMPLDWDSLTPSVRSDHFRVGNAIAHVGRRKRDPWEEFRSVRQSITAVMRKKVGMGR